MSKEWRQFVTDPSSDALNERIAGRLRELENELRQRGLYIVCGAEQKFILFDKDGGIHKRAPDLLHIGDELIKSGVKPLERVEEESRHAGKYQVVLGSVEDSFRDYHPSVTISESVLKARKALPSILQDDSDVSFAPAHAHHREATAGLHMNTSLFDADHNNLFYDQEKGAFSELASRSAANLVTLQKEGQPIYIASDAAFDRIGKHNHAPTELGYSDKKGRSSVALRNTRKKHEESSFSLEGDEGFPVAVHASYIAGGSKTGNFYRIEDRLASADSNPYLVALADVGAIYEAAVHPSSMPHESNTAPIKSDRQRAMRDFENSALWRDIAGPYLLHDIVRSLKAQEQSQLLQH